MYCFFGSEELLKNLFVFADKEGRGYITAKQFTKLVNDLHKGNNSMSRNWMLSKAPSQSYRMTYQDFASNNINYPKLVFPVYQFQASLRRNSLGEVRVRVRVEMRVRVKVGVRVRVRVKSQENQG
jgi:hypothetical protein